MTNNDRQIIQNLIEVLLDPDARIDEQDDAAIDLREYNDDRALSALIRAAQDPKTDDYLVLDTCGDSIAHIWIKRNYFSKDIYNSLRSLARVSIYQYIEQLKPEWIEKFDLQGGD